MRCDVIASGSTGNAVLLDGEILIDCGVPFRALESVYRRLRLVLLTHQHGDHFNPATIKRLHFLRPSLRFCVPPWLAPLLGKLGVDARVIDTATPGKGKYLLFTGRLMVGCEEIPHDVPNCCWHIALNDEWAFYATDCGSLDDIKAQGYDLYMVEANHTQAELAERLAQKEETGQYAYERRAAEVHLSYEQAMDWIAENADPNSQYILLHQHTEKEAGNGLVRGAPDNGAAPENA